MERPLFNGSVLKLDSLDLSLVRDRLIARSGFTPDRADHALADYKGMLALILEGKQVVRPLSSDGDEAWHAHILFTQKYTEDCQKLVGRYIHHLPDDLLTVGCRHGDCQYCKTQCVTDITVKCKWCRAECQGI